MVDPGLVESTDMEPGILRVHCVCKQYDCLTGYTRLPNQINYTYLRISESLYSITKQMYKDFFQSTINKLEK